MAQATDPVLKEGHLLLYDTPTAQWQRTFVSLTSTCFSAYSTESRYARLLRPILSPRHIKAVFCSTEEEHEGAAERHFLVLGLLVATDLLIFRTLERRWMAPWAAKLRTFAQDGTAWRAVEDMQHYPMYLSPQLYTWLFRREEETNATGRRTGGGRSPPRVVRVHRREPAKSVQIPRRMPLRTANIVADVDALVNASLPSARRFDATVQGESSEIRRIATETEAKKGGGEDSDARQLKAHDTPKERVGFSPLPLSPAVGGRPTPLRGGVSPQKVPTPPHVGHVDPLRMPSPENNDVAVDVVAAEVAVSPAGPPDRVVQELRRTVTQLSSRNIDLEVDNANCSARILELEGDVDSLKATVVELRRRCKSLEQQLECQEVTFKQQSEAQKQELMLAMEAEAERKLQELKDRFVAVYGS